MLNGRNVFSEIPKRSEESAPIARIARIAKNRRNCLRLHWLSQIGKLSLLALFGNRGSLGNFLRDMDPSPASRDRDFRKEQHLSPLPSIH
jgi:hypothetical protein